MAGTRPEPSRRRAHHRSGAGLARIQHLHPSDLRQCDTGEGHDEAPSFWHGWSPDGKTLAFVGRREGEWDIYAISRGGGEEATAHHLPRPRRRADYTPDGAFIYYNSFCSGKMEIWRMHSDGSGAEQVTHDAYANWFPHPSPDGRWVVYLAYLENQAEEHPFGKQVKLRLIDTRDGSVRDLTPPFVGGQGTITFRHGRLIVAGSHS